MMIEANALKINPDMEVYSVSSRTGQGLEEWIDWLTSQLKTKKATQPGQ